MGRSGPPAAAPVAEKTISHNPMHGKPPTKFSGGILLYGQHDMHANYAAIFFLGGRSEHNERFVRLCLAKRRWKRFSQKQKHLKSCAMWKRLDDEESLIECVGNVPRRSTCSPMYYASTTHNDEIDNR